MEMKKVIEKKNEFNKNLNSPIRFELHKTGNISLDSLREIFQMTLECGNIVLAKYNIYFSEDESFENLLEWMEYHSNAISLYEIILKFFNNSIFPVEQEKYIVLMGETIKIKISCNHNKIKMKFSKFIFIPKFNENKFLEVESSDKNIFTTKTESKVNCDLEDFAEKLFFEMQEINKISESFKKK